MMTAAENDHLYSGFANPLLEYIRSRIDNDGKGAPHLHLYWVFDEKSISSKTGLLSPNALLLVLLRLEEQGFITHEHKIELVNGQPLARHHVTMTQAGRAHLIGREKRVSIFFTRYVLPYLISTLISFVVGVVTGVLGNMLYSRYFVGH